MKAHLSVLRWKKNKMEAVVTYMVVMDTLIDLTYQWGAWWRRIVQVCLHAGKQNQIPNYYGADVQNKKLS